jgi:hypothetical protein
MNLELTIQNMFDDYPTLFKERSDCLDHLFCAIGNGYEWRNGELCSCGYTDEYDKELEPELKAKLVNGKAHQYNKMSLRAEAIHYANMRKEKRDEYPEVIQKELDQADKQYFESLPDDVYHKFPRKQRWYFYLGGYCTKFAYLFNYPYDIKPDWLEGIKECKRMLIEDGYDVKHPDENPIDTAANFEECRMTLRNKNWQKGV